MPEAIDDIRKAGVGPVDMQQSVIGPGMGVFTRYTKVLESDDSPMSVKTALSLINRVWEEIENELDANFDPETQVALAWFANYGFDVKPSGELTTLANAKNIPDRALFDSGVIQEPAGKTALTKRSGLGRGLVARDRSPPTVWECVQHTARVLKATGRRRRGGGEAGGADGAKGADAQKLAYRLFEIRTQRVRARRLWSTTNSRRNGRISKTSQLISLVLVRLRLRVSARLISMGARSDVRRKGNPSPRTGWPVPSH